MVTANPDEWDGDMRTWEALAAGALVVTDKTYAPLPWGEELRDGEHLIIYDNTDRWGSLGLKGEACKSAALSATVLAAAAGRTWSAKSSTTWTTRQRPL